MILKTANLETTLRLAEKIGANIQNSMALFLSGPLGAGKTTFVKGLAKGLEIQEKITSPTFTMVYEYYSGKLPLCHFDFYSVLPDSKSDKISWLIHEVIQKPEVIIVVEWFNQLANINNDFLSKKLTENFANSLTLNFAYSDSHTTNLANHQEFNEDSLRIIEINALGHKANLIIELCQKEFKQFID